MSNNPEQPYLGPRPFEAIDKARFFGRSRESQGLFSLVIAQSEVLLFAQSGAGKTSLINAGLVPQLVDRGCDILPTVRLRDQLPQGIAAKDVLNIFVSNALAGWPIPKGTPSDLTHLSLAGFLSEKLERKHDEEGSPVLRVIIFDQFEELFTAHPERAADRKGFFEQIRDALSADSRLRIVFAMREEYLAALQPYASILRDGLRTRYRLECLRKDKALDAISGPLKDSKVSFAEDVAEKLVDELLKVKIIDQSREPQFVRGEYVEPVQLQVVCENLWRNLPPGVTEITEDHRKTFGDVDRALEEFYRRCLFETSFAAGVRERRLRKWFDNALITPVGTRNAVWMGQSETAGLSNTAVNKLEDLHLIRGEEKPWRGRWYELTHDRLIEPIRKSNREQRRVFERRAAQVVAPVCLAALVICAWMIFNLINTSRFNRLMANGYHAANENNFPLALSNFNEAKARKNGRFETLFALGATYANLTNLEGAITNYRQASLIDSSKADTYLRLGRLYLQQARNSPAEEIANYLRLAERAYRTAAERDEKDARAYVGLGNMHFEVDFEKAQKDYARAIELDPTSPDAHTRLGDACVANGHWQRAFCAYITALGLGAQTGRSLPFANLGLGNVYDYLGEADWAVAQFNRAVGASPDLPDAKSALAIIYARTGQTFPLADELLKQLIKEQTNNASLMAQARTTLGYIRLRKPGRDADDLDFAANEFKEANRLMPKSFATLFNLGMVLGLQGKTNEAVTNWTQAAELPPPRDVYGKVYLKLLVVALAKPGSVNEMTSFTSLVKGLEPAPGLLKEIKFDAGLIQTEYAGKVVEFLEAAIREAQGKVPPPYEN